MLTKLYKCLCNENHFDDYLFQHHRHYNHVGHHHHHHHHQKHHSNVNDYENGNYYQHHNNKNNHHYHCHQKHINVCIKNKKTNIKVIKKLPTILTRKISKTINIKNAISTIFILYIFATSLLMNGVHSKELQPPLTTTTMKSSTIIIMKHNETNTNTGGGGGDDDDGDDNKDDDDGAAVVNNIKKTTTIIMKTTPDDDHDNNSYDNEMMSKENQNVDNRNNNNNSNNNNNNNNNNGMNRTRKPTTAAGTVAAAASVPAASTISAGKTTNISLDDVSLWGSSNGNENIGNFVATTPKFDTLSNNVPLSRYEQGLEDYDEAVERVERTKEQAEENQGFQLSDAFSLFSALNSAWKSVYSVDRSISRSARNDRTDSTSSSNHFINYNRGSRELKINETKVKNDDSNDELKNGRQSNVMIVNKNGNKKIDSDISEGRYIKGDPLKGYYDFVITEGSYKFWAAFQLFTAGLMIYSTFAAIYYSKVNPIVSDYDYYSYLGGRSLADDPDPEQNLRGQHNLSDLLNSGWVQSAAHGFQFILDAVDKLPTDS